MSEAGPQHESRQIDVARRYRSPDIDPQLRRKNPETVGEHAPQLDPVPEPVAPRDTRALGRVALGKTTQLQPIQLAAQPQQPDQTSQPKR
jgi:hypothetical protein